jgi:hypothetical protein
VKLLKPLIVVSLLIGLIVANENISSKWQPSLNYMFDSRDEWKYWMVNLNVCIVNLQLGSKLFNDQEFNQKAMTEENISKYQKLYKALYRDLNSRGIGTKVLDDTEEAARDIAISDGFQAPVAINCMLDLPKLLYPQS